MPNKKKVAAKATTKKATPKTKSKVVATLSSVDRFFIEGNYETWTPEQLAAELGKPVELVNDVIAEIMVTQRSTLSQSFNRPAQGVVCMTEGSSGQADDLKGSQAIITQAHIQKAVEAGDYIMAQKLKEAMEAQKRDAHLEQCAKYKDCWHFITPPEVHHARLQNGR